MPDPVVFSEPLANRVVEATRFVEGMPRDLTGELTQRNFPPAQPVYLAITDEVFARGNSGSVRIYSDPDTDTGNTKTVWYDWMGVEDIEAGVEVVIQFFPTDRKWRIVNGGCEPGVTGEHSNEFNSEFS